MAETATEIPMPDTRALGKLAPRLDPRTLRLSNYVLHRAYAAPPPLRDWVDHSHRFALLGNDVVGDCAFAAQAHLIQCFAAAHDEVSYLSTTDVLAAYSEVTGYSPLDPATDRGTVMLDALNHWRKVGIGARALGRTLPDLPAHQIGAYVKLDQGSALELQAAINLFGGICVGVQLPLAAKNQTVWDVAPAREYESQHIPGSWGGHVMACAGYSRIGVVLVSWGKLKIATWEWLFSYADEIYAVISSDWVSGEKPAPSGLDLAALRVDLAALATWTQ